MATFQQIRDAWDQFVWANEAIVEPVLPREYTQESEKETASLRYKGKINFWTYTVELATSLLMANRRSDEWTVTVSYFLEHSAQEDNYNTVLDKWETLYTLVKDELGLTWDNLIAGYNYQKDPVTVEQIEIDSRKVWRMRYKFIAFDTRAV